MVLLEVGLQVFAVLILGIWGTSLLILGSLILKFYYDNQHQRQVSDLLFSAWCFALSIPFFFLCAVVFWVSVS